MRYIDYLKTYVIMAVGIYPAMIMGYYIACYLRAIQPTPISAGTIVHAVSIMISSSLWYWWFDSLKK